MYIKYILCYHHIQNILNKQKLIIILVFGFIVILYHAYKSFFLKDAWINYIHIFIVGPLLVFIGLYKNKTPTKIFELVLMVASAAIGYHAYKLINGFNDKS
jgi:hypothetical protein